MALHKLTFRTAIAAFGIVAATVWNGQVAQGQYTFIQDTNNNGFWIDYVASWLNAGVPATDYPNAAGATVLMTAPLTTSAAPSATYTYTLPATPTTIGELKIDNTGWNNTFVVNFANNGGELIFDSGSSAPAKYTETAGTNTTGVPTAPMRYNVNPNITLNSDLELTQDNVPSLNTGTQFPGLITGGPLRTITKKGVGAIQFNYNATADGAFEGQLIIEGGGVRMINSTATLSKSSGVTVKSGGQLEFSESNTLPVPNFNFGTNAVLNLNGNGKTTGSGATGALQVEIKAGETTTFHNPVVLQTTANINVATGAVVSPPTPASVGALEKAVSGPGGLIKSGAGTLSLLDVGGNSSYTGDTTVSAGTLSLSTAFLFDNADIRLPAITSTARLNLNFGGVIDTVRSLYYNGVAQPVGVYGPMGSANPNDIESPLITGDGYLNVTTLPVPGDFNNNGIVDAGDYVLWRKGGPLVNEVDTPGTVNSQDYEDWRARFGNPFPGSGSSSLLSADLVPEPTTIALLISIVPLIAGRKLGRKRA